MSRISGDIKVKTCRRSVAAAGTREQFETGSPDYYKVKAITIRADEGNTGNLYLGDSNRVSSTDYSYILAPGESISLSTVGLGPDVYIDLTQMWIDADTNGNALSFIALQWAAPW